MGLRRAFRSYSLLEIVMEKTMSGEISDVGMTATGARVQNEVGRVSEGAHRRIDSLADAAEPAVASISEGAHTVVDKMAGAATQAARTVEASGQQLKETQERVAQVTSKYMQDNPVTSLAIAVGAGFLLSRLLSSR